MPRKSRITVSHDAEAVKNRNAALARRLSGNPFGGGTKALPLKEPHRWHTYLANTFVDENAFYAMKEMGWVPLTADDLACSVEESGLRLSPQGYLVRGAEGREMMFKMAAEDYRLLTQAKSDANLRSIGSASRTRSDIAEAASSQLGDEAASYLSKLDGQVIDTITGGGAS